MLRTELLEVFSSIFFFTQSTLNTHLFTAPGQLDDSSRGINGKTDVSKKPTVPGRYQQFMTSEDEAQSSSSQSSSDEEETAEKKADASVTSVTSTQTVSSVIGPASGSAAQQKISSQVVNSAIISYFSSFQYFSLIYEFSTQV